ncbi:beta-ketoacyl-acyl carrier protein synthase III 1 [Ruminococcaceae bacterium BL-6]|nr:beta-ketoacyl-acyl carrier protein synthase III 1 [Ruminococcaceae bacterium BL-6]
MKGIHIAGTGSFLPRKIVSNQELSKTVDTNDEWIVSRTGIRERRFCTEETNTSMTVQAAKRAMERASAKPEEIGACIVATFTPDFLVPCAACTVQRDLGLPGDIPAFDLNSACSGFLYGIQVARGLLLQSNRRYALLICSEVLSRVTDFSDRNTCVLFGDGAGAAVLELSPDHCYYSALGAKGDSENLFCPGVTKPNQTLHMNGREVFRFAVKAVPHCMDLLFRQSGLTLDQIDYVVCHQANERIIAHIIWELNAPDEKFYRNVQSYGNTSAASIPIALDEMVQKGLLRAGMKILCVGFGGGLTWGGAILEW